jgi:hypothetical protein
VKLSRRSIVKRSSGGGSQEKRTALFFGKSRGRTREICRPKTNKSLVLGKASFVRKRDFPGAPEAHREPPPRSPGQFFIFRVEKIASR